MSDWKEYSIEDVAEILSSGGDAAKYPCKKSPEDGFGIPVYANSLENEGLYGYTNVAEINDDAVCIAARGAGTGHVYYHKGPFVPIVRLITLVPKREIADTRFLYYYLSGKKISGDGSAIPQITLPMVKKMEISLPSLSIQKRISSILSTLDYKIECNRRINENLEKQAQALFKSWFVDFEPFKDQPFVESELGMIPQGWKAGTLEDICIQSSQKVGRRNDVKVLSPVTTGELVLSEDYFTKQVFSESLAKYRVVKKGSFAYNPARVNIGSLGRNEFDFDGAVSPVYVVFECKEGYGNYFDLFRKTDKFKSEVLSRAIGGVRQSLNYVDFSMIQAIIAPKEVVDSFNPLIENIKALKNHIQDESLCLAELRDTLLPKLMSGELNVENVNF